MAQKRKGRVVAAAVLAILAVAAAESWAVTICDVQEYDDMGLSPMVGQTVTDWFCRQAGVSVPD